MTIPILEAVLQQLKARTVSLAEVSRASGVPYQTLKNIAFGYTKNPGVQHVQRLADYFANFSTSSSHATTGDPSVVLAEPAVDTEAAHG